MSTSLIETTSLNSQTYLEPSLQAGETIDAHPAVYRHRFVVGALLYFIAIALRLYGVTLFAPHPDELLWIERAKKTVSLLSEGRVSQATNHLGHPGIPPVAVMAVGQEVQEWWSEGERDPLFASRVAVVLFSSLVVPILFLGLLPTFAPRVALLAAALLAVSPIHAANSQMAHVDAVMTVFLVGCLFVYQQGVELGSWPVKLGAGALWGLSIASKATAVLFIPILLGWRFLRKERWPFSWSDVWALLLGQAVLAALFTRLWHHKSFYARDLGIKSVFADTLYEAGIWLQSHPFIALFFSISLAAVVILSKWRLLKHSGGLLFVLSSALILFPQVPETLWRFWLRIAGLKGVQHNAYGFVFPPPPDGYIGIYTNCFPVLSIVAFSLGGVLALCRYSKASSERDRFILWMVIAVVLWTLPLSTSGKQSSRYILAVVPGICVVAAYGLDWMMARVLGRYALLGALLLTTVSSGGVFLKWYPDYHLYHNWLRGGLLGAAERGNLLGGAGEREALHYLHNLALSQGRTLRVNILGNPRVFSLAYRRALKQHQLELFFEPTLFGADYLIIVPSLFQKFQHDYGFLREHLEPVWRYEREGVTLLEVTLPPKIREDHPLREPVSRLHSQTGRIVATSKILAERRADIPNKVVEAKKKKHAPGFLAFGIRTKVEPGTYRFRALLGVPRPRSREANVPLVELSLTEGCKRAVIDQELPKGDFASVQLLCVIQETQRITPKVYWLGTRSVMLAAIEVEKLPTGGPSSAKLPSAERVHAPSAS